jgi:membrane protease YdiL (CAAX protease family)
MIVERYRHPILFYGFSISIPWLLWFIAAFVSHLKPSNNLYVTTESVLGIIGLATPMIVAFALMLSDTGLREDLSNRLFHFNSIKPLYVVLTFFLMLSSILFAQAISLLFGYSASQFSFSQHFSFTAGLFPAWFLLLLAPVLEELAWHTYGTDCLRRRFNLFTVSMFFAVFWASWHLPLAFVKDYYQSNLVASGVIYSINFVVSLFPYVLLMNWLYYKTNRNIYVAIVFHITAGFFNEIFATNPNSKIIQTVLLLILSIVIVIKERGLFFRQAIPES